MENQHKSLALSQTFALENGSILEFTPSELASMASRAANAKILPAGFTIEGKYRIISLLGEGGMGAIYSAHHLLLNKRVALKTIHANQLSSDVIERFEREVKAVAALQNPYVVQIFDFGLGQDNKPYYTMELLSGQSLADAIESQGPLSIEQTLTILSQACAALLSAHKKGIVHRDLKPANIFLHTENGQKTVKLVDFGIAKLLDSNSSDGQKLTTTGTVFGSPLYMSPEQSLGERVDARSDIYSLGCTLTECLTGRPPFIGPTIFATICLHQHGPIPRLIDLAPNLSFPSWLEALIERMLTKNPDERIQTCEEILGILQFQQSKKKHTKPPHTEALLTKAAATQTTVSNATESIIDVSESSIKAIKERAKTKTSYKSIFLISVLTAFAALSGLAFCWHSLNQQSHKRAKPSSSDTSVKAVPTEVTDLHGLPKLETKPPDLEKDFIGDASSEAKIQQPRSGLLKNLLTLHSQKLDRKIFQKIVDGKVEVAELSACEIDNKDLELLKDSQLEKLNLGDSNLDDIGAANIAKSPKLSFLRVSNTKITPAGLLVIAKMPQLQKLYVEGLVLDRNVLKALGDNHRLSSIGLKKCRGLSYANLAALQGSRVEDLDLQETAMDDQTLMAINNLPELEKLSLNRTKVTAAGVHDLCKRVSSIDELPLGECPQITPLQIAKLKNQFRKVSFESKMEIEFDVLWENARHR